MLQFVLAKKITDRKEVSTVQTVCPTTSSNKKHCIILQNFVHASPIFEGFNNHLLVFTIHTNS